MSGGMSFYLLIYFSFWHRRHYDAIAIYVLHYSFLSVMKVNVWHTALKFWTTHI